MFLPLHASKPEHVHTSLTKTISYKKQEIKTLVDKLREERELLNSMRASQLGHASMFADRTIVSRDYPILLRGHPDGMVVPMGLNFVWININLSYSFVCEASPDPYSKSGFNIDCNTLRGRCVFSCKEYETVRNSDTKYVVAHTHYLLAKKVKAPYLKQMIRNSMPTVYDIESILQKKAKDDMTFFVNGQNISDIGPREWQEKEYGETCVSITPRTDYYSFRIGFWIPCHCVGVDFPGTNVCDTLPDETFFIEQVDDSDPYLQECTGKTSRLVFVDE